MPKTCYQKKRFRPAALAMIEKANEIIGEYVLAGYNLTLRQLFYQFVSRDLLPNTVKSYKQLGDVINNARLAGLIDWNYIEDRTRGVEQVSTWSSPGSIVSACASQFKIDLWKNQAYRIECWIEKEALAGVFERVCKELRIPYLSCRGYTSQSEMWRASNRMAEYSNDGKTPVIFHFGDHDPSGMDMSRDIEERLEMFMGGVEFHRLALNMDQVQKYNPPPNPAKMTDTRSDVYIASYGSQSWELDALDPATLSSMLRNQVLALRDEELWNSALEEENEHKRLLRAVSDDWDNITEGL